MGFHCRKLLHQYQYQHQHEKTILFRPAPSPSPLQPPQALSLPLPLPMPRLRLLPLHDEGFHLHLLQVAMIVMACTVGIVMLLCTVSLIRRNYYSRRHNHNHNHNHMRGNTPILFDVNGDSPVSASDDDDEGPIIDHPIWFIRTVGLQQSVIDSITVFTYRKDERLIDGTECSVCLGEFQEDESLRLLPKCSHAFHIPCIDTWLTSHKNCPLCRAPVVHDAGGGSGSGNTEVRATEPDSNFSGENQEATQMENLDGGVGNHHVEESESGVLRIGTDDAGVLLSSEDGGGSGETPEKMLPNSDKVNLHASISDEVEEEIQPMRRSVSMDSCAASIMFRDVADLNSDQDSSETQLGGKINSSSKDMTMTSAKQGSGSSSSTICKLASIGRALQKRPISLRSSFSHSRKSLSSRHGRSQSSTLPL